METRNAAGRWKHIKETCKNNEMFKQNVQE